MRRGKCVWILASAAAARSLGLYPLSSRKASSSRRHCAEPSMLFELMLQGSSDHYSDETLSRGGGHSALLGGPTSPHWPISKGNRFLPRLGTPSLFRTAKVRHVFFNCPVAPPLRRKACKALRLPGRAAAFVPTLTYTHIPNTW